MRRVAELEPVLTAAVAPLSRHPRRQRGEVRTGLLAAVEIAEDYRSADPNIGQRLVSAVRDRGVITRLLRGVALQISPPFVITETELGHIAEAFAGAFDEVTTASTMMIDLSHGSAQAWFTYPGIAVPEVRTVVSRAETAARLAPGVSFEIEALTLAGNTGPTSIRHFTTTPIWPTSQGFRSAGSSTCRSPSCGRKALLSSPGRTSATSAAAPVAPC